MCEESKKITVIGREDFKCPVGYELDEDNVYLLDRARFSFDGGEIMDEEEILRIDNRIREKLSWPPRQKKIAQPWAEKEGAAKHFVTLYFEVESEVERDSVYLGIEGARDSEITWNGRSIDTSPIGYFVDKAIDKLPLGALIKGKNTLEVKLPYLRRGSLEWTYLLGDFGVRLSGASKTVTNKPEKLGFGSIVHQGFPFYSGNITYLLPVKAEEECQLSVKANAYRGALMKASLDGEEKRIVFAPYEASFDFKKEGEGTLKITLFGNRHNTFAPLHNSNEATYYFGPDSFRSEGDAFAYEYFTKDFGILKSPVITYYKEEK